jgi:predicted ATP-dependent endonuclease of OLD family
MKIKQITLSNFKRFVERKSFRFNVTEGKNDLTLILGNNGSGKSSLLQAIVAVTASATRDKFKAQDLDWPGFEYRNIQSGRLPVVIECEYCFVREELEATQRYAQQLIDHGRRQALPALETEVKLSWDPNIGKAKARNTSQYFQFSGYQYAKMLAKETPNKQQLFQQVGNVFWYNEQRTSYSISNLLDSKAQQLVHIRRYLQGAYAYHLGVQKGRVVREGEFDFYEALENRYRQVFPDRSFVGSTPSFDQFEASPAADFYLSDGKNQYEISEMSAGERAIFPMLLDFARWNINNSIIIIDEIELHLHPPLQQALVRALPKLGQNNQFIITSHSQAVAGMFKDEQIIRL